MYRILSIVLFFITILVNAQDMISARGYFLYPINPGKPQTLAGTMGELRSNHFHGGIDVRTNGQEGLSVLASADGYVSKIQVSTIGYGNMIFITHPNGFVTVYAHLKEFNQEIGNYARKKQYEKHTFEIEITVPKNILKVKKGEEIALSGNTGSSRGPHLHFEIRDTLNKHYNPLSFGFTEIKDDLSPVISKVALKTMDINSRINNTFGRYEYTAVKKGKIYTINDVVKASGTIGIEIETHDRANGTTFKNGVNCIEMEVNNSPVYFHNIETFENENTRSMNVHIDYSTYKKRGAFFQKCYVSDGNKLSFYQTGNNNGFINITDTKEHEITLRVWDSFSNMSEIRFKVKGELPSIQLPKTPKVLGKTMLDHDISENTLKIIVKNDKYFNSSALLFFRGYPYEIPLSYIHHNESVFLWDLRKGVPDSVEFCGLFDRYHFKKIVPHMFEYAYFDKYVNITFPSGSLFDTLYLQSKYENGVYHIHNEYVPVFKDFTVTLKAQDLIKNKVNTSVYSFNSGVKKFIGGIWKGNEISFSTRYLGKFILDTDLLPPTVVLKMKKPKRVVLSVSDNKSGIGTFDANLNGKWILVKYEHKLSSFYIDADEYHPNLKGVLQLVVTDNAGNQKLYKTIL
jgi:murein DD-endopeptidase MepM/ murein hydrolase activator NlpD